MNSVLTLHQVNAQWPNLHAKGHVHDTEEVSPDCFEQRRAWAKDGCASRELLQHVRYRTFLTKRRQNDHFHISHYYQPVNNRTQDQMYNLSNGSTGSVVRSRPATPGFMRSTSYRSYLKPLISRTVRKI